MKSSKFKLSNPPKKNGKKYLAILLSIILILIVGLVVVLVANKKGSQKAQQAEQKTKDEAQTDSSKDFDKNNNAPSDASAASQKKEQVPDAKNSSIKIDSFSQSTNEVIASASINSNDNSGYCIFSYTSEGGRPVVSDRIVLSGNTCNFSEPSSNFDYLGSWKLNVTYYVNGTKMEASQNVTIS